MNILKTGTTRWAANAAGVFAVAALISDEFANLKDVCIGTGKKNDRTWYMERPREDGDPHGQAALSWICGALMSPCK